MTLMSRKELKSASRKCAFYISDIVFFTVLRVSLVHLFDEVESPGVVQRLASESRHSNIVCRVVSDDDPTFWRPAVGMLYESKRGEI